MIYFALIASMMITQEKLVLVDFENEVGTSGWQIVDDVVMGGRSSGDFHKESDCGVFSGYVSLENDDGFSSVRYLFEEIDVSSYSKVLITLKGDGKSYQFRSKDHAFNRHAYIQKFKTSGKLQMMTLALNDFYPTFRGRQLPMENFSAESLEEIQFLIANKKEEQFRLEIRKIEFQKLIGSIITTHLLNFGLHNSFPKQIIDKPSRLLDL